MKIIICLTFMFVLSVFSLSIANGVNEPDSSQMQHDSSKEMMNLLKDESQFFSNQKSGGFHENFVRKATQEPSNSITIKAGTSIVLTGTVDRTFSTILVEGDLRIIDTGDSAFRVQKIIVAPGGSLIIGDNQSPIESNKKVEVSFVKNKNGEIGIFVFGKLLIHGKEISPTFVGLENFARKWDKKLAVDSELRNWEIGDEVVVTSPGDDKCNEVLKISKIVNQEIILQNQLNCSHRSSLETGTTITSHIALLSRNVKISSEDLEQRGSVNFFHGSSGYIKYAQFDKLGPKEVVGRYPIHFHHMKETSRGIEVIGNSITNSDNRWITIHDSNGILVKNNVGYISQGHGFFLEDGNEFDNIFEKNIGIITKTELILKHGSSVFWTQNPMNVYHNNVAVNGQYYGYSFHIPNIRVYMPNTDQQFNLRSFPSLEFEENIAYNFLQGGMRVSRTAIEHEWNVSSEIIISNFDAFSSTLESSEQSGIIILGSNVTISNSTLLNNIHGIRLIANDITVIDTKIKMDYNIKPNSEFSGILIAGSNNLIKDSEIIGYNPKNQYRASDISLSNDQKHKGLISAKIINVTQLGQLPFYFGDTVNEKSFLEIYGYKAPFAKTDKLPENFMLKKTGIDMVKQRGEYTNPDFDAMVKIITKEIDVKKIDIAAEPEYLEKNISILFKEKTRAWSEDQITDSEFLKWVSQMIDEKIIPEESIAQLDITKNFIPRWVKDSAKWFSEGYITEKDLVFGINHLVQREIIQIYN